MPPAPGRAVIETAMWPKLRMKIIALISKAGLLILSNRKESMTIAVLGPFRPETGPRA
jgi:hypothetical protein